MKHQVKRKGNGFTPIELKLVIENKDELNYILTLFNKNEVGVAEDTQFPFNPTKLNNRGFWDMWDELRSISD